MLYVNSIVLTGLAGDCTKSGTTKDGQKYAFSSVAVKRPEPSRVTDYITIVGFGDIADKIAMFSKNTPISVKGRLEANRYKAAEGVIKESFRVVVDSITRIADDK